MSAYLKELSEENKESLLKRAKEDVLGRSEEAKKLQRNLKRLNPRLAQHFKLKIDTLQRLRLRMLCYPRPDDSIGSGNALDEPAQVNSFIIVSYSWHNKEQWTPASAALVDPPHPEWKISQPMVNKILSISRSEGADAVWLDQLCIRQGDSDAEKEERQVAVGLMDIIYRSARRLLIILEDVQLDAGEQYAAGLYRDMFNELNKRAEGKSADEKGEIIGEFVKPAMLRILEEVKEKDRVLKTSPKGVVPGPRPTGCPSELHATEVSDTVDKSAGSEGATPVEPSSTRFIMKILGARWFSRAWCAHECRVVDDHLHNSPLFLCFGSDGSVETFEFKFILFTAIQMRLLEPDPAVPAALIIQFVNDPNPQTLYQRSLRMEALYRSTIDIVSLQEHYMRVATMGCRYGQDLVSIALNTAHMPLVFTGSLSAEDDRYWMFSVLSMAASEPGVLVGGGQKMRGLDSSGQRKIVSWIDNLPAAFLSQWTTTLPLNTVGLVEKEYIELDLYLFQSYPALPSDRSMEFAKSIVETYLLPLQQDLSMQNDNETTIRVAATLHTMGDKLGASFPGHETKFLTELLGSALDMGIDWIVDFPRAIKEGTEGYLHGTVEGTDDRRFEPAAKALLVHLGVSEDNSANSVEDRLQPTIQFLSCIIDSRVRFLTTSPRAIPTSAIDFAITTSTSDQSYVAVPVGAATMPAWANKAWIVEPFDPDASPETPADHVRITRLGDGRYSIPVITSDEMTGSLAYDIESTRAAPDPVKRCWRLRRRNVLYGNRSPLRPDGANIVRLDRQKVYGAEDYDWAAIRRARRGLAEEIEAAQGVTARSSEA